MSESGPGELQALTDNELAMRRRSLVRMYDRIRWTKPFDDVALALVTSAIGHIDHEQNHRANSAEA